MNLGRLGKQLKSEIIRGPKKAAFLGVACLVAMYFWGPLIWNWLPNNSSSNNSSQTAGKDKTPDLISNTTLPITLESMKGTTEPDNLATIPWKELNRSINNDRFMTTAIMPSGSRNPFQPIIAKKTAIQTANNNAEQESVNTKSQPQRQYTPQDLNLVLESVVIGPRFSMAVINGKSYREGSSITGKGSADAKIEFILSAVRSDSVTLERGEKSYSLEIKKLKLAGNDRIKFFKPASSAP